MVMVTCYDLHVKLLFAAIIIYSLSDKHVALRHSYSALHPVVPCIKMDVAFCVFLLSWPHYQTHIPTRPEHLLEGQDTAGSLPHLQESRPACHYFN